MARKALSRRERLAAITGGVIDDSLPADAWRARLRDEPGHSFDLEGILASAWSEIAWARGIHVPDEPVPVVPPSLEPGEIRDQAAEFVAAVDRLLDRLKHLHPDIEAHANSVLYQARGEFFYEVAERLQPDLLRIRAAVAEAGKRIRKGKSGPKATFWTSALDALTRGLIAHSAPPMNEEAATSVALDLLESCGLRKPKPRRKKVPPKTRGNSPSTR